MDQDSFKSDVIDLFSRKRGGHVERWLYGGVTHEGVSGSVLWAAFVRAHNNYYVLPNEIKLIGKATDQLSHSLKHYDTVADFGTGPEHSVRAKALPMLRACEGATTYAPIDLSEPFLQAAVDTIHRETKLNVTPFERDFFSEQFTLPGHNRLGLMFGATVSNTYMREGEQFPEADITGKLANLAGLMNGKGDNTLLVSFDANPDEASIREAYNHTDWKRFVSNLSYTIGSELKPEGDYRPSAWRHEAHWDQNNRVLHHCVAANEDQSFIIDGQHFDVRKDDRFVAINCFKFPVPWFQAMAKQAGFENGEPIFDDEKRMVIQPLHS